MILSSVEFASAVALPVPNAFIAVHGVPAFACLPAVAVVLAVFSIHAAVVGVFLLFTPHVLRAQLFCVPAVVCVPAVAGRSSVLAFMLFLTFCCYCGPVVVEALSAPSVSILFLAYIFCCWRPFYCWGPAVVPTWCFRYC